MVKQNDPKPPKQRTQIKALPKPVKELKAELKKVKGGAMGTLTWIDSGPKPKQ